MPRYIVERTFIDGLDIPSTLAGLETCLRVVDRNAELGVNWLHSYVTTNNAKTFCVYDGPDEDAICRAAYRNRLPVDRVTRVSVLDPFFHQ